MRSCWQIQRRSKYSWGFTATVGWAEIHVCASRFPSDRLWNRSNRRGLCICPCLAFCLTGLVFFLGSEMFWGFFPVYLTSWLFLKSFERFQLADKKSNQLSTSCCGPRAVFLFVFMPPHPPRVSPSNSSLILCVYCWRINIGRKGDGERESGCSKSQFTQVGQPKPPNHFRHVCNPIHRIPLPPHPHLCLQLLIVILSFAFDLMEMNPSFAF